MQTRLIILFLAAFWGSLSGYGQQDSVPPPPKSKKVSLLPLPLIGSNPETRLYFGAALLASLDFYQDSVTRISSAELEFNYTLNRQMIFDLNCFYNTRNNDYIIVGNNSVLKFPEYFWGVGNDTPESNEELYQAWRIELNDIFLRKIRKDLYAGILFRFQSIFQIESDAGSLLSTGGFTGAGGGVSSGLGYALYWDRRDNILNPSGGGSFLSLQQTGFFPVLGSDFTFSTIELDGRIYFSTWKEHVLAFQTYNQFSLGDPPFRMMGLMGSGSHMRGYYRGRYRDKHYLSVQGEYRLPVWKFIGLAAFGGMGEVTADFKDIDPGNLKWFAGGALRIRVNKADNVWLRADYAVGRNTSGFYFSFGESF